MLIDPDLIPNQINTGQARKQNPIMTHAALGPAEQNRSLLQPQAAGPYESPGEEEKASYTCRRCRTELFTEGHLEPHAAGAQAITRRRKAREGNR